MKTVTIHPFYQPREVMEWCREAGVPILLKSSYWAHGRWYTNYLPSRRWKSPSTQMLAGRATSRWIVREDDLTMLILRFPWIDGMVTEGVRL